MGLDVIISNNNIWFIYNIEVMDNNTKQKLNDLIEIIFFMLVIIFLGWSLGLI